MVTENQFEPINQEVEDLKDLYPVEYRIEPPARFSLGLEELWHYRELFYFFTWRDIKVKYKQAALGFLWAILQPLALVVVFTLVFGKGLNVETDGIPYPVFAYSGLLFWNIFASGLQSSANSMVTNANIIRKIYFPRLIIPMSAILVSVFDFVMALVVYSGLLLYYHQSVNLARIILLLPFSLILTVIATFGLGTLLAALNVKYRDFQYTIPFLIQFLMFINPVVYSTSIFRSETAQYVIALNPMAGAINLSRAAFLSSSIRWDLVSISVGSAILLFMVGIYVFRKTEAYFADLA
ncbi:ABC transporter permease [Nibrella saemangeumensis]|uniref:Transport permease protein n=1 Tax=Nibrella saemangeumensis TaxID=1084526 RepID=A0ABP8N1P7_9BACT